MEQALEVLKRSESGEERVRVDISHGPVALVDSDSICFVRYEDETFHVGVCSSSTLVSDVVRVVCSSLALPIESCGLSHDDGTDLFDSDLLSEAVILNSTPTLVLRRRPPDSFRAFVFSRDFHWRGFFRRSMTASEALLHCCNGRPPARAALFDPTRSQWLSPSLRLDQQPLALMSSSVVVLEIRVVAPTSSSSCFALRSPLRLWTLASASASQRICLVALPEATGADLVKVARPDSADEVSLVSQLTGQPIDQEKALDDEETGPHLLLRGSDEEQQAVMQAAAAAFGGSNPYNLLPGERVSHKVLNVTHWVPHVGKVLGTLLLTPFRLLFVAHDRSTYSDAIESTSSIPLRTIHKMSRVDTGPSSRFLEITCRNFEAFFFMLTPQKHSRRTIIQHVQSHQELPFALLAGVSLTDSPMHELTWLEEQYRRVFGESLSENDVASAPFRLCRVNEDYSVCSTYPRLVVVPSIISDAYVVRSSEFRSRGRFLATVWRHADGPTITRCSQPMVGMGKKRCMEDEAIVAAIGAACNSTVCLIDSRPLANAVANKLVGAGSESGTHYEGCEIKYIGLANIHSVRESWNKMRTLCQTRGVDANYSQQGENWLASLHAAEWLQHVQHVLEGASAMARVLDRDKRSCITHCSDGWDRTSQLCSLAQLMLDPYYRTLDGFPRLVHKEWLAFGHKFETRAGGASGSQERDIAPIFLLFLDCVFQMQRQFYSSFEFSAEYLVVLLDASYSGQFGTFLFDSEKERLEAGCFRRCASVWTHLKSRWSELKNPHFRPGEVMQIYPSTHLAHLALWNRVYLRLSMESDHEKDKAMLKLQKQVHEQISLK